MGMWISLQTEFSSIVVWRKNLTTWQAVLLCPVSSPWDRQNQSYHQHDQHHDHHHHHYDKIAFNAWDGEKFRRIEPLKRLTLLFRAALTISVAQFAVLQFLIPYFVIQCVGCTKLKWSHLTPWYLANNPLSFYELWNNWPCFQASGSNVKTKILPCKQMTTPTFYLVSKWSKPKVYLVSKGFETKPGTVKGSRLLSIAHPPL